MNDTEARLARLQEDFEAGRRSALLDALAECARSGQPMPEWLSAEWLRVYQGLLTGRESDLNALLGHTVRDPRSRSRRYTIAIRAAEVGNAIIEARLAERPLDNETLEAIGARLGLSLRQVRECKAACEADMERGCLAWDDLGPGAFSGPIRSVPPRG